MAGDVVPLGDAIDVNDRLSDLMAGLGGRNDRSARTSWMDPGLTLTAADLSNAYRGDWVARKGVDIPAFDMIRAGRDWQADTKDIEKIEAQEKRLGLWAKLLKAKKLARLYGGAVIILGVVQGQPGQLLRPAALGFGALKYLHVVDRHKIHAGPLCYDLMDPLFGEPRYWTLYNGTGGRLILHPSRVIPVQGADAPMYGSTGEFWGDSVLLAAQEAVINAGLAQSNVVQLITEAKVDVFKIKNLTTIAKDPVQTAALLKRFALAKEAKSTMNALVTDAEEDVDQKQIQFAQLPEIVQLYMSIAAAAWDIPATRFLSRSPDGMNSTGTSDMLNYETRLSSEQELELRPVLDRIDAVAVPSALGSFPEELHYDFAPLREMTEAEKAEIFAKKATAARTLVGTGGSSVEIIPAAAMSDALVASLVEDQTLPGLEAAIEKHGTFEENEPTPEELAAAAGLAAQAQQPPANGNAPAPTQRAANDGLDRIIRGLVKPHLGVMVPDGDYLAAKVREMLTDARPRSLYVRRDVENWRELDRWAKSQGFTSTLGEKMHATVMFSRTPVDWMKIEGPWSGDDKGRITIPPGGARLVEPLGDKGAVVLLFSSWELSHRHAVMREAGARPEHEQYQPHITQTYEPPPNIDLAKVEPYRGQIILGPEVFEEVNDDWSAAVVEK